MLNRFPPIYFLFLLSSLAFAQIGPWEPLLVSSREDLADDVMANYTNAYGAFALGRGADNILRSGTGLGNSYFEAEQNALISCGIAECAIKHQSFNGCSGFAVSEDEKYLVKAFIAGAKATYEQASFRAQTHCQSDHLMNCRVIASFCTTRW